MLCAVVLVISLLFLAPRVICCRPLVFTASPSWRDDPLPVVSLIVSFSLDAPGLFLFSFGPLFSGTGASVVCGSFTRVDLDVLRALGRLELLTGGFPFSPRSSRSLFDASSLLSSWIFVIRRRSFEVPSFCGGSSTSPSVVSFLFPLPSASPPHAPVIDSGPFFHPPPRAFLVFFPVTFRLVRCSNVLSKDRI